MNAHQILLTSTLEIKMVLNDIKIVGEVATSNGETTGCFIYDLGSLDCRQGCDICPLIEKSEKLYAGFSKKDGPGI